MYKQIVELKHSLMLEMERTSNNKEFNNALNETIASLNKLKKYY